MTTGLLIHMLLNAFFLYRILSIKTELATGDKDKSVLSE